MMVLPAGCIADVLNVSVIGFELALATRSPAAISKTTLKIWPEDVIVPEPTPAETKSIVVSTLIPLTLAVMGPI